MKKRTKLAAALCCLGLMMTLALPAFAAGTITTETTMGEIRSDPGVQGAGIWTNSKFRDIKPLQTYYYNKQTLAEFVGSENAEASAAGLNLAVENYEAGRQVTYKLYSDEEIAADPTKEVAELNYFPAKTPNAKYALVLSGNISTRTAELKECISTAYELHEKGYAVFTMRYRVFQNASDNAPLEDIGRAVQYITEHAAEFAIQPENYAIVGYSMGGHLTGLFGSDAVGYKNYQVPEPAALLLGYPVNNMTLVKGAYRFLQDPGIREPRYYTMNVSDYITDDFPATYHWHGKDDVTLFALNAAQQEPVLEAALAAHNVPHKYVVYDHAPHVSGIGTGTDADGWLYDAAAFWEEQVAQKTAQQPAA